MLQLNDSFYITLPLTFTVIILAISCKITENHKNRITKTKMNRICHISTLANTKVFVSHENESGMQRIRNTHFEARQLQCKFEFNCT